MKKLLLIFILLGSPILKAQSLIVTDVTVTTVEDGINVRVESFSGNGAGFLSDSYEIAGNTINVTFCYWFNMTLPVLEFDDNLTVPLEENGEYTVNVTVYNSSSTTDCDEHSVAGSDSQVITYLSTSDFEKEKSHLRLFPNPTRGIMEFSNGFSVNSIKVYDNLGRLVREFHNLVNNKINLEGLSEGLYVVSLEGEQRVHSQKILLRD